MANMNITTAVQIFLSEIADYYSHLYFDLVLYVIKTLYYISVAKLMFRPCIYKTRKYWIIVQSVWKLKVVITTIYFFPAPM